MKSAIRYSLASAFVAFATALNAGIIGPDFTDASTGWHTDRYDPHSFSDVGTYQGRNDVLGITITSAEGFSSRPSGYQSTFYNTQGRQHAISGGAGSELAASLWIPSSWGNAANGSIRTDMWGVMTDGSQSGTGVSDYPIIGFSNYGGDARFRVWDENLNGGSGDWVNLSTTINYNSWNSLGIRFTGSSYVYSINGVDVFTDSTVNGSTGFLAEIMQAYNFYGDPSISGATPVDYTAYWAPVPEPSTFIAAGLLLLPLGASALRIVRRKAIA